MAAIQYIDPRFITPTGGIIIWHSTTPPTGWLLCNAAAVSRTTYVTLFAVIGTTYGVGDGSTTFNLPGNSLWRVSGSGPIYLIIKT